MHASLAFSRIVFVAVLLACSSVAVRADSPVVATVLKLRGHWTLNGGAEVVDSQELPAGAVIQPQNAGAKREASWSFIAMVRGTGQLIGCKSLDTSCHLPIQLPQSAGGDPATQLADNVAHGLAVGANHHRLVPNHVRSALRGGAILVERIVPLGGLDGTTLDAAAFIVSAPVGDYQLRLRDIDLSHPVSDDVYVKFSWKGSGPLPLQVGAHKPGLYEVELFDSLGSYPRTDPVWVGLVDNANYASDDARFASLRAVVKSWGPDADPFVVERFLRAGLEYVVDGDVNR